jgi:hypothetical protein
MDNDVIVAPTNVLPSSWYTTFNGGGELNSYRIVGAACRITYTGAALDASGRVRIWRLCGGGFSSVTGSWPTDFGDVGSEYYDYSALELAKGVTVFLYRMDPQSKVFEALGSTQPTDCWQGFQLMAKGLPTSSSFVFDWRQTIEYTAHCGTISSQVASPTPPSSSALDKLMGIASQTMKVVDGPVQKVLAWSKTHLTKLAFNLFKDGAKQAIQTGTKFLLDDITKGAMASLGEDLAGLELLAL